MIVGRHVKASLALSHCVGSIIGFRSSSGRQAELESSVLYAPLIVKSW